MFRRNLWKSPVQPFAQMEVASKLDQVALLFIQTSFLRELGDYTALLIDLGKPTLTTSKHLQILSDTRDRNKFPSFTTNKQRKTAYSYELWYLSSCILRLLRLIYAKISTQKLFYLKFYFLYLVFLLSALMELSSLSSHHVDNSGSALL